METFIPKKVVYFKLFLFLFFAGSIATYAQVQQEYVPRYNETVRGDFTMIANSVLSRNATEDYNGERNNNNFNDNVFVDIDDDETTFNSSSANLSNPVNGATCVAIKKAYLYWAAANRENGQEPIDPEDEEGIEGEEVDGILVLGGDGNEEVDWNFNEIKLMLPGLSDYEETLTADEVIYNGRENHFYNDPYICVKDITSMVQELEDPFGRYQVANVKATVGSLYSHSDIGAHNRTGTSGGWQIVFVYEGEDLNARNITIFDGYAHISADENNFDIEVDGFQTVPNGEVKTNLLMGALEGDRTLDGDGFFIKDIADNWVPFATTNRAGDNFFNSRITVNNNDFIDRIPQSTNTLGFDAALFELNNPNNSIIDNNQTNATVRMSTSREIYGLYLFGLSVEVWEPSLNKLNLEVLSPSDSVRPEGIVQLALNVKNTGNDDIEDLVFVTRIPNEFEFVDTEPLPEGVTFAYDEATRNLTFTVPNGLTNANGAAYSLIFNVRAEDDAFFESVLGCFANPEMQTNATFSGAINMNEFTDVSSHTFNSCGLGNKDATPISIRLNHEGELEFVGDLPEDVSVHCDEIPEAPEIGAARECDIPQVVLTETATNNRDCSTGYEITRTWTATDSDGNTITHTQIITVYPEDICINIELLHISKALTPNGDGINDVFTISGLEFCNNKYELVVFNRWGGIVYQSDDYQNDWSGKSPNTALGGSETIPSGTYFYTINFNGLVAPITGFIYFGSK